jgi:acyl-CoA thioester hydrolase
MTQPIAYGEYVVSQVPFVVRRRVKWGDCDPEGMVYTVMFSEFVISAAELFYESILGGPAYTVMTVGGYTTPSRGLSFDFRSALAPDDEFEIAVAVAEVRNRTYVLDMTGRRPDGELLFLATLTPICIALGERRSIDVPPPFRAQLEAYQAKTRGGPRAGRGGRMRP